MNTITVEVCVDNLPSLKNAIASGAGRIELCSALPLGGLTPTYGLVQYAASQDIPVYAMVRPRCGDFLYSAHEIDLMCAEISWFRDMGMSGIVVGALTETAEIDLAAMQKLMQAADGFGVTFHRAFDLVSDQSQALEILIDLGCERALTSGGCITAEAGMTQIAKLVRQSAGRIAVMPGSGITPQNARVIMMQTGASELHLSGKKSVPSKMRQTNHLAAMGDDASNDAALDITDSQVIMDVVAQLRA